MPIQTTIQMIFEILETKLTEKELFNLKTEIINAYAEGFFDANHKKIPLRRALLSSNILKDIGNGKLNNWVERICA